MDSNARRKAILDVIRQSDQPLSASKLAKQFQVSRQLIVGDVALLRAQGMEIIATPRGYVSHQDVQMSAITRKIAVEHRPEDLETEIYTIVDLGGALIDVIIDHPLYGELCGALHIYSRYDADQFFQKVKEKHAKPLSDLTDGIHLHTIQARDEESCARILEALRKAGLLYEKNT